MKNILAWFQLNVTNTPYYFDETLFFIPKSVSYTLEQNQVPIHPSIIQCPIEQDKGFYYCITCQCTSLKPEHFRISGVAKEFYFLFWDLIKAKFTFLGNSLGTTFYITEKGNNVIILPSARMRLGDRRLNLEPVLRELMEPQNMKGITETDFMMLYSAARNGNANAMCYYLTNALPVMRPPGISLERIKEAERLALTHPIMP